MHMLGAWVSGYHSDNNTQSTRISIGCFLKYFLMPLLQLVGIDAGVLGISKQSSRTQLHKDVHSCFSFCCFPVFIRNYLQFLTAETAVHVHGEEWGAEGRVRQIWHLNLNLTKCQFCFCPHKDSLEHTWH